MTALLTFYAATSGVLWLVFRGSVREADRVERAEFDAEVARLFEDAGKP